MKAMEVALDLEETTNEQRKGGNTFQNSTSNVCYCQVLGYQHGLNK